MALTVTTAATQEPLTVEDVKRHLNLLNEDHDTYLESLIGAARAVCETRARVTAITTTYTETFDCFPSGGAIELTAGPVQSVSAVRYTDTEGTEQALSGSDWTAKLDAAPAQVLRGYGVTWPSIRDSGVAAPVSVEYVAGYTSPDDVPDAFKHAMKLMIGHWWSVRESVAQVSFSEVPMSAKSLLATVWRGDYP